MKLRLIKGGSKSDSRFNFAENSHVCRRNVISLSLRLWLALGRSKKRFLSETAVHAARRVIQSQGEYGSLIRLFIKTRRGFRFQKKVIGCKKRRRFDRWQLK